MHVFLLIFVISGRAEKVVAMCDTYQKCSDEGAALATQYENQFGKLPRDVSFRVEPATVIVTKPGQDVSL
jgi:hypothetical protein